ncbi:uncharacterized protein CXQ87_000935 [Candidozyma duobushaemuli]|uniref:Uncharacterized protein n=1 Tax=Candidozyma duobushaemuli TaxID=1231522 RepID=A0A2V1AJT8_9ASCO|nr:uncharacterized protein CXQ87_000935 [[Candida] duobushaemulonis]PVH18025.1 hypothetical protein CXQ87_000935 [[Candida] duobushaemulonis]
MSALLMLPASGQQRLLKETPRKTKHSKQDLYALTRTGSTRSTRSKQSLFSSGSGIRGSSSVKAGQYDAKKLKALDEQLETVFDKKVWEFDYKLDVLANKVWNHPQNEAINLYETQDKRFVNPKSIAILRYTYFEKFEDSYDSISQHLNSSPKPAYWSKVWDYDAYNHCHLFGASCKKNLLVVDQALVKKNMKDRRTAYHALKDGVKVDTYDDEPDRETSIQKLWHTSAFWDNVFYDARSASHTEDYNEWLPPVDLVQRFFITLTDYALYNLHVLDCKVDDQAKQDLSDSEEGTLSRQYFYYYNDSDYAYFEMLAKVFRDTFMSSIRAYFPEEDVTAKIDQVIKVLVETICSNLQINYFGGDGVNDVLDVWHDFLMMALQRLVIANVQDQPDEAPSKEEPLAKPPAEEPVKPKKADKNVSNSFVVMLPNAQNDHQLMSEHAYYDRSDASGSIVSPQYHGPLLLGAVAISVLIAKFALAVFKKRSAKPSPKTMTDQMV